MNNSTQLEPNTALNRRAFLTKTGAGLAAFTAFSAIPGNSLIAGEAPVAPTSGSNTNILGPYTSGTWRRDLAYELRKKAAWNNNQLPNGPHPINGDETALDGYIGQFSKTLPHNSLGEVDRTAYAALIKAIKSGKNEDFEAIPGGPTKLVSPQAAYAFGLEGADSWVTTMRPAPAFSSAEAAGEMAECYWHALLRDVPFAEYEGHSLAQSAATDLSRFSDFRGPKSGGSVTPGTLFRGPLPGDLSGPYISQFLYQNVPNGARLVEQVNATMPAGSDFMTSHDEWLRIQNGGLPPSAALSPSPRYMLNGRDLAEYVHRDYGFQCTLDALLIMLFSYGPGALNPANPYRNSIRQAGFVNFGKIDLCDAVTRVARDVMRPAWFQKWCVHRRLRPEEFSGRVHHRIKGAAYPIHSDLFNSAVLDRIYSRQGNYLLSQAYPEGCPAHPAYPSGHATFAGAGVTVLKALFDENFVIPNPVVPTSDGRDIIPYNGPALTIGGELNKLASNIAFGRNFAGVHWRTDAKEGMCLGEAVAISCLRDRKLTYHEGVTYSFTKFDGTRITI